MKEALDEIARPLFFHPKNIGLGVGVLRREVSWSNLGMALLGYGLAQKIGAA